MRRKSGKKEEEEVREKDRERRKGEGKGRRETREGGRNKERCREGM